MSHLTRGAWIEILQMRFMLQVKRESHLTRGAWIEIKRYPYLFVYTPRRTSHEVRGLKFACTE